MTQRSALAAGFTAVELLITLFVAAAFLIAGYQLFNVVISDGGTTRAESAAGNVAYDYLRRYSDSATNPCAPATPVTGQPVAINGFDELDATISVVITCPQSDAVTTSKVEATLTYGAGADAKTVKYATFIDKSRGASPDVDVTDGLIGWWKLNENSNSSAGPYNGTPTNTTAATGQNGQPVNAFSFNGTSSFVTIPMDKAARPTDAYTVTGWFWLNNHSTVNKKLFSGGEAGGFSILVGATGSTCSNQAMFSSYIGGSYQAVCGSTITVQTWVFAAGVYDGASERIYVNGTLTGTLATSGLMTQPDFETPFCIGAEPDRTKCVAEFFPGSIDDVRYYDRALSASEITQLYNGGAK